MKCQMNHFVHGRRPSSPKENLLVCQTYRERCSPIDLCSMHPKRGTGKRTCISQKLCLDSQCVKSLDIERYAELLLTFSGESYTFVLRDFDG